MEQIESLKIHPNKLASFVTFKYFCTQWNELGYRTHAVILTSFEEQIIQL
jgi:hypothetical protein